MLHWSFGGFLAHARPVQGKRERKRGWLRFCHTGANSVRRCKHFQRIPGGSRILRILNGRQQCDIACLAIVLLKRRSLQNASGGTSKLAFSVKNQDLEKHKHKNIVTKDPKSTHPCTSPSPSQQAPSPSSSLASSVGLSISMKLASFTARSSSSWPGHVEETYGSTSSVPMKLMDEAGGSPAGSRSWLRVAGRSWGECDVKLIVMKKCKIAFRPQDCNAPNKPTNFSHRVTSCIFAFRLLPCSWLLI